jgi:ABC-type multidrug transport system permease subunit
MYLVDDPSAQELLYQIAGNGTVIFGVLTLVAMFVCRNGKFDNFAVALTKYVPVWYRLISWITVIVIGASFFLLVQNSKANGLQLFAH